MHPAFFLCGSAAAVITAATAAVSAAAAVISAAVSVSAAVVAAIAVPTAAAQQDDDQNDPQASTKTIVSATHMFSPRLLCRILCPAILYYSMVLACPV